MLFNSLEFIVYFLPIVLSVYILLEHFGKYQLCVVWLFLASVFFYGYWNWVYVFLLLGTLIVNYWLALGIMRTGNRWLTGVGITANLLLLGYFKYTNFFLSNVADLTHNEFKPLNIILPLGISFFTFQKIAFLADVYAGKIRPHSFPSYGAFISFFPQLIAGPIVHYQDIVPQFVKPRHGKLLEHLQVGFTLFVLGLFKKYAIADGLAPYANQIFKQADGLAEISLLQAIRGDLAYTLQIYFDFSGYSDMAIGLGILFGLRLPLNFFSPYKCTNISDFWRCWHITLSRFLRDYLYIAFGGNRKGNYRTALNLIAVMLIGGLWHGAGWNFVIWGLLHGSYLAIYQIYNRFTSRWLGTVNFSIWARMTGKVMAWVLTFICIALAWVFFRAETLPGAKHLLAAMTRWQGASWEYLPDIDNILLVAFVICLAMPNTWQLLRQYSPTITPPPNSHNEAGITGRPLAWQANYRWGIAIGFLLCIIIVNMMQGKPTQFIYFQF